MHGSPNHPALWPSARRGWYVTILFACAYFIAYVDRSIISLLIEPIKHDLVLTDTQIGLVTGFSFALFNGLAGIPLGRMSDTGNRKWIIGICIVAWSFMTALCGVAKTFVTLFLARIGVGVGEGGLNAPALSIISDHFPAERRHFAVTTFNVGGALGGGMALLLGAILLGFSERFADVNIPGVGTLAPWQWTFILVSLPGLLIAALILTTVREPVRQGTAADDKAVPIRDVIAYFRTNSRAFVALYFGLCVMFMVNMGYLVWGPTLFVRVHGMELTDAGALFGGSCFVSALIGNYVCAAVARRHALKGRLDGPLRTARTMLLIVTIPMCIGALIPDPYISTLVLAPAIGLMVGMASLGAIAIQTIVPNRLRGQAYALFALLSNLLAGGLSPLMIALLTDNLYGESQLHYSTTTMALIFMPIALLLLHQGLPAFRRLAEAAQAAGVR